MRGVEQIPWLYDLSMALMPGMQRWRRSLAELARGRVLEVGCGTGQMLPLYPDPVELFALDPNRAALDRARRRSPEAGLMVSSAEHLPFADALFDTVVSGLVFCSVPDPARGLAEIRRVLDTLQPPWTLISGGCHPNRDTEIIVENAGFCIERPHYRAHGVMRHFVARKTLD